MSHVHSIAIDIFKPIQPVCEMVAIQKREEKNKLECQFYDDCKDASMVEVSFKFDLT